MMSVFYYLKMAQVQLFIDLAISGWVHGRGGGGGLSSEIGIDRKMPLNNHCAKPRA